MAEPDGVSYILFRLDALLEEIKRMASELDALKAEVARNTTVTQSAITLIQGLAAKIDELKTDPAALSALAAELRGSADSLSQAVTANTPTSP